MAKKNVKEEEAVDNTAGEGKESETEKSSDHESSVVAMNEAAADGTTTGTEEPNVNDGGNVDMMEEKEGRDDPDVDEEDDDAAEEEQESKEEYKHTPEELARMKKKALEHLHMIKVGTRLEIFWPLDDVYYPATIVKQDEKNPCKVEVSYDDPMEEWIDLTEHDFNLLDDDASAGDKARLLTPPPDKSGGGLPTATGAVAEGLTANPTVTPSPANLPAFPVKVGNKKKSAKPNREALEAHRKWQEAAEAMGGPGARIIVKKSEAKKRIYDTLYDAFRPMNITQIHQELKAIIPNPLLKTCLDDMALDTDAATQFADDSDDEEDGKAASKKKGAKAAKKDAGSDVVEYKGTLKFKGGKGASSNLYYVDYSTAINGDGLDREEKNELAAKVAAAEAEKSALERSLQQMTAETAQLLSEPTNEELAQRLDTGETELVEIQNQVEETRKYMVNENDKQKMKRNIENMAAQWRKRRRICMDFLIAMEENTDGAIRAKACLAGDGQIEIDSDEQVAKAAVEYAKQKRKGPRTTIVGKKKLSLNKSQHQSQSAGSGIPPSESFVAVTLDSQGIVQRVFLDDDEENAGN